jgi:hypothetical protein
MKEKRQHECNNPNCRKTFDSAKEVTYLVCPFCETIIEDEKQSQEKCLHHFGYLSERKTDEIVPTECIECMRSVECMLSKTNSKQAAHEIQNWYEQMDPCRHK